MWAKYNVLKGASSPRQRLLLLSLFQKRRGAAFYTQTRTPHEEMTGFFFMCDVSYVSIAPQIVQNPSSAMNKQLI